MVEIRWGYLPQMTNQGIFNNIKMCSVQLGYPTVLDKNIPAKECD